MENIGLQNPYPRANLTPAWSEKFNQNQSTRFSVKREQNTSKRVTDK